jgi:hypothetical protein
MQDLLDRLEARLQKRLNKARRAFLNSKTQKQTENCKYRGSLISGNIRVCLLKSTGGDEHSAGQCWDQKASFCVDFKLRRTLEQLSQQFASMSEKEIQLRWPSIAELCWMKAQVKEVIQLGTEKLHVGEAKAG